MEAFQGARVERRHNIAEKAQPKKKEKKKKIHRRSGGVRESQESINRLELEGDCSCEVRIRKDV